MHGGAEELSLRLSMGPAAIQNCKVLGRERNQYLSIWGERYIRRLCKDCRRLFDNYCRMCVEYCRIIISVDGFEFVIIVHIVIWKATTPDTNGEVGCTTGKPFDIPGFHARVMIEVGREVKKRKPGVRYHVDRSGKSLKSKCSPKCDKRPERSKEPTQARERQQDMLLHIQFLDD